MSDACGSMVSLRDAASRWLRPLRRKGRDEHVRLRLPCPCAFHPQLCPFFARGKQTCFPFFERVYKEESTMDEQHNDWQHMLERRAARQTQETAAERAARELSDLVIHLAIDWDRQRAAEDL